MSDQNIIKELAKRMIKAQGWTPIERSKEHDKIKAEARDHRISINEVGVYAINNEDELKKD